jgi:parvulin-like peptidyl-prolyl isomerase
MSKNRLVAALVALGALLVAAPRAEIIEQVLVKVNGEIFTKTELEARQVQALRALGQQIDLKNNPTDAELRKALAEVTPQLIVDVVDEMLVLQRGRELGYKLADDQFTSVVENIKKENKIANDDELKAALTQEGLTMADLRKNVERSMIMSRVQQNEVMGRIGVSEDEIQAFYKAHISEFTTPQTVTLREIFVTLPEGAETKPPAEAEAKQKIEQVHRRLAAGESFEKLVGELSDAPSRANAGLIGPFSTTDLSPDLRKAIDSMKPGEVSPVLRTARGYQVLKLETSTPAQTTPLEQAREQVSERVFVEKRNVELEKYLEKLRGDAIIEWKSEELKRAYDAGVSQMKAKPGGRG